MTFSWFDELRRLQQEFDRVFEGVIDYGKQLPDFTKGKQPELYRRPSCDIQETDTKVIVTVDIPGVDKKDIKLNITEDSIEIKANKKKELEEKKKNMYRYERSYSGFYRYLTLPTKVIPDKADAEYKDGVLKVTIEKIAKGKKKAKEITVR